MGNFSVICGNSSKRVSGKQSSFTWVFFFFLVSPKSFRFHLILSLLKEENFGSRLSFDFSFISREVSYLLEYLLALTNQPAG